MAQSLSQGGPENEAREEKAADRARDQVVSIQNDETNPEEHSPLEDLGYRHLEGAGRNQGMIFDEQDVR